MAATNYYIDPVSGSDSNGGTSDADAWQTLQKAATSGVPGAGEVTYFNLKDSGTDTLSADINWGSINFYFGSSRYVVIRGYTSTAGDGGIGVIDLNGYHLLTATGQQYVNLENLDISGGTYLALGADAFMKKCKLSDMSSEGIVSYSNQACIEDCEVTNINGIGINNGSRDNVHINRNHIYNSGGYTMTYAISLTAGNGSIATNNIINMSSTSGGITAGMRKAKIQNNTLFTSGTGSGIVSTFGYGTVIENNIFEGWNKAVDCANGLGYSCSNNHFYDNTTDIDTTTATDFVIKEGNYLAASGSVLAKSGSNTHANRFTYFAPTGDALGGTVDGNGSIGAVQLSSSGGGGSSSILRMPGMTGGMNG